MIYTICYNTISRGFTGFEVSIFHLRRTRVCIHNSLNTG
ncbi:hypothetical protein EVA_10384 [gut metagenome]|uniref:Uncharacterized protein n=1 Tax=gut metagenome TaxID=749906 RepID=J9G2Q9_9ZZZZ